MAGAQTPTSGAEISLRIGQRVRHGDYLGRRVTGIVRILEISDDRGLTATVLLDEPIVIHARGEGDREVRINWQTVSAHELAAFDERDELIGEMLAALQGALRVADRATDEFDAARAVIAKAIGAAA